MDTSDPQIFVADNIDPVRYGSVVVTDPDGTMFVTDGADLMSVVVMASAGAFIFGLVGFVMSLKLFDKMFDAFGNNILENGNRPDLLEGIL